MTDKIEIPINDATKRLLDADTMAGVVSKGARRSGLWEPGDWMIELSPSTLEALEEFMAPGESYDEAIARLHAAAKGLHQ